MLRTEPQLSVNSGNPGDRRKPHSFSLLKARHLKNKAFQDFKPWGCRIQESFRTGPKLSSCQTIAFARGGPAAAWVLDYENVLERRKISEILVHLGIPETKSLSFRRPTTPPIECNPQTATELHCVLPIEFELYKRSTELGNRPPIP